MSFLDLYKLQLNDSPAYSASFITTPSEDLPDGCVLPSGTSIPNLPSIDITLPSLVCNVDVLQPLIPPPFFNVGASGSCSTIDVSIANDTGSITVDGSDGLSGSGTLTIDFTKTTDTACDQSFTVAASATLSLSDSTPSTTLTLGTPPPSDVTPCDDSDGPTDWVHLTLSGGPDYTVGLAGKFPFPCFTCVVDDIITDVSQVDLDELQLGNTGLGFNSIDNSCCTNQYSWWNSCGTSFQVGATDDTSTVTITTGGDGNGMYIKLDGIGSSSAWEVSEADFESYPDSYSALPIKPVEYLICYNGTPTRVMLMSSQGY